MAGNREAGQSEVQRRKTGGRISGQSAIQITQLDAASEPKAHGYYRPFYDVPHLENITITSLGEGLDRLKGLPKSDACALVAAFEMCLEITEHLVNAHRLGNGNVQGQQPGIHVDDMAAFPARVAG